MSKPTEIDMIKDRIVAGKELNQKELHTIVQYMGIKKYLNFVAQATAFKEEFDKEID